MTRRPSVLNVGLVQMISQRENRPRKNVARATELIEEAASNGAAVVCLQEFVLNGAFTWNIDRDSLKAAEPLGGESISHFRRLAKQLGITLVLPFFEADERVIGRRYNSAALIGPGGDVSAVYRKLHLPLNGRSFEKYYFAEGDQGVGLYRLPGTDLQIGIAMCYDRHFDYIFDRMAEAACELIFIPTSTSSARPGREEIWLAELSSIAYRTGAYVVGVNSTGNVDGKVQFGKSAVFGPDGVEIQKLDDREASLVVPISLADPAGTDARKGRRTDSRVAWRQVEELVRNGAPMAEAASVVNRRWCGSDVSYV